MDNFVLLIIIALIYILMISYVGYLAWKRTKSADDYMVAEGKPTPL